MFSGETGKTSLQGPSIQPMHDIMHLHMKYGSDICKNDTILAVVRVFSIPCSSGGATGAVGVRNASGMTLDATALKSSCAMRLVRCEWVGVEMTTRIQHRGVS